MEHTLTTSVATVALHRTEGDDGPLRAWDAADEYALDHVGPVDAAARVLVVNDGFGALAASFATRTASVVSWSDSVVAHRALHRNLDRNDIDRARVEPVVSTEEPTGRFDVVVVKVPRTLRFLDAQLRLLRDHVDADTVFIGAGMTKSIHNSTTATFVDTIGPTPTSLARKKARLLLPTVDPDLDAGPPAPPLTWTTDDGIVVTNHANVFSAERLDRGAAVLLAHLPRIEPGATVVDLGCGNGVVGATIAARVPGIRLVACDESHHAVASARATIAGVAAPDGTEPSRLPEAEVFATDVLDGIDVAADVVVINPPFHAGGARTSDVAARMFAAARRVLVRGGTVCVVGNRHLGYHALLTRQFQAVTVVSQDSQFVVVTGRA